MVEKQPEKPSLMIRLLIRGRNFEISTEGKISDLQEELDSLAQFANTVSEKLGLEEEVVEVVPTPTVPVEEAPPSAAEIPVIRPSRSTSENILSLFNTPWGRTPRSLAEVTKALEVNAVPESTKKVSVYLLMLARRGQLRRIEKEGRWCYYRIPTTE